MEAEKLKISFETVEKVQAEYFHIFNTFIYKYIKCKNPYF
jgi:hypothetical protein